jgi:hypothetical protein
VIDACWIGACRATSMGRARRDSGCVRFFAQEIHLLPVYLSVNKATWFYTSISLIFVESDYVLGPYQRVSSRRSCGSPFC